VKNSEINEDCTPEMQSTWVGKMHAINWEEVISKEMAVFHVKHYLYYVFYVETDNNEFYLTMHNHRSEHDKKQQYHKAKMQRRIIRTML